MCSGTRRAATCPAVDARGAGGVLSGVGYFGAFGKAVPVTGDRPKVLRAIRYSGEE